MNADRIERLLEDLDAAHEQLGRYRRELADAREAIATERARFRELFEISREGHVVTTGAGVIVECNQAAAALLNRPAEYLVGKPLAGYVTSEHRRGFRVRLYRAGTAGAAQEWTTTVEHPDLPRTEVSVSVTPVVDERGAVEMLRWLIRDVSNARAGLVALREPGAVMRAALDALSAHIAVLDTEGGIVTVNRAWQDAVAPTGLFESGAQRGDNYLQLCDDAASGGQQAAESVRGVVERVLRGSQDEGEVVYSVDVPSEDNRPSGVAWFSLRVARSAGAAKGYVVVTHEDVSAQQLALARERALMEERTARSSAEAANRAKSEFLATLSHELRTPLNAIGGYAQLLEMGVRGPVTLQQAEDLRRILRSEQHLLGLINELLNFSRLEQGRVHVELAPVEVDEVVREVLELIEPQARARGLHLESVCDDVGLTAATDPEKFRQILINVLSNAVKFTLPGGTVRIECRGDDESAYVRVTDTGIGIPQGKLDEIFDPFVQIHRGFNAPSDGIGLGLAISRNLARAMSGDLRVTSEVGKGSSFELAIPRANRSTALT